jgi:hypothetical protein
MPPVSWPSACIFRAGPLLHLDLKFGIGVAQCACPLLEFAVGTPQRGVGDAEDQDNKRRHEDQRSDDCITCNATRQWLALCAKVDGADPLRPHHHRHCRVDRIAAARVTGVEWPRQPSGRAFIAGKKAALCVINAGSKDLRVDPKRVNRLLGGRRVAEIDRRAYARS